jgi:probable blue pigment (indigoidine) exporter
MHKFSARDIFIGLLFSMLWSSASVAGKFGLRVAEPLVLFTVRFLLAGALLLAYVYGVQKNPLPRAREWKQITIFGTFNTALYLGLFIIALQYITPGITTLAIALNPLFISVMTAVWMKRRIPANEWGSIGLGIMGVFVAAYPLLQTSHATPGGLALLALSMLTYSFGAVYYAAVQWQSSRITINAWQVFIGGWLVLPLALIMHKTENTFNLTFWMSLTWLIIPVSVVAVNLWLRLLKSDAVRASLWLYLCPIFGFFYSYVFLGEPLTLYTLGGTVLVMTALYIGQRKPKTEG